MKRRELLLGLGAASLGGCSLFRPPPTLDFSLAQPLHLHVATSKPGAKLDGGSLGLSFETAALGQKGFIDPGNAALLGLLRGLGPGGVLRLGGQTCDRSLWRPSGGHAVAPYRFVVDKAALDRLSGFLDACGWSLIYGIDLAHGTPARAADEAAAVQARLGNRLLALQFGNAPDAYARQGLRPGGYDPGRYCGEWERYARAVRQSAPGVPLAGPEAAGDHADAWTAAFLATCGEELRFVSAEEVHTSRHERNKSRHWWQRSDAAHLENRDAMMKGIAGLAHKRGLSCRITQAGDVSAEGDDTLGAALWAIRTFYRRCGEGWAGLCFHEALRRRGNDAVDSAPALAGPLYYGLRLLAMTLPGRLVDVRPPPAPKAAAPGPSGKEVVPSLQAFAVLDEQRRLQLVLVNSDARNSRDVRITCDRPERGGDILRLDGPGLYAGSQVRLASGGVDPSGRWQPQYTDSVQWVGKAAYLTVGAGSAALVLFD